MKKHRKLVALLVALTFLFSIVAPVMAATPSEAEKAADKLNVLGIIEGYPDGSFGLDRNITRAEFAKIAVVAAGLKDAAEQLVNFPSQFSDVKVGEWYTGWINMAASQGFVKGDPAGTFRPNDNITYAEVVTVLVRLLGYNDNLPGPWPTNYLAKAVELGITDGVTLNASAPAVRGDVFVMTNNTLDCELVQWSTDKLDWIETGKKLIVKSFKGEMYEGLVTGVSWDSKGDLYVDILGYGKNAPSGSMKVIKNVVVTGAADPFGLLGKEVEFIRNEKDKGADRNAIVYLGAKETDVVSDDEATLTDDYIEIDGKKYDLASGFDVTFFPVDGEWDDEGVEKADKIEVVLNEDGEAQWAFVYNYPDPDVIKEIDGDRAFGYNHVRIELDEDEVQVFVKDGAIASFDALAEGDLVYVYEDVLNADLLVIAVSEVHEGTLETAHKNWNHLTIDGTRISTAFNGEYIVSNDGGDSFNDSLNNDMFGETIKYMLSPAGRIAVVISGAASTNLVGVVEYVGTTARGVEVRIVNPDSTKSVYYVDSDYYKDNKAVWETIEQKLKETVYTLVEYSLDSSGKIDYVNPAQTHTFLGADGNRAQIGDENGKNAKWYRVLSDAAFFGFDTKDKIVGTKWDTFKTSADDKPPVQVVLSKGAVKAMYIASQIVDKGKLGVIAGSGRNAGGYYYDVFVGGERVRYNLTNAAANSILKVDGKEVQGWNLPNGTVIEFDLSSGKINEIKLASRMDHDHSAGYVTERGSDYIQIDGAYYWYFDEDTMIVDDTRSTKRIVNNVARGDYVVIYGKEDAGVVELVVITKEPAPTPPDPGLGDGGTETYIVKGYNDIFGRFTLENRAGEEVILFVEDFDGFKLNGVEVSETVMLHFLNEKADGKEAFTGGIIKVETTKAGDKILVVNLEGVHKDEVEQAKAKDEIKPEFAASKEAVVVEKIPKIVIGGNEVDFKDKTVYMAQVTLKVDTDNDRPVRLSVKYDDSIVTVYVQDSKGKWYQNPRVWGPAEGFSVKGGYEATTTVYFTVEGEEVDKVEFTITLVDVEWSKDEAEFVYGTKHFTIELPEVEADEE